MHHGGLASEGMVQPLGTAGEMGSACYAIYAKGHSESNLRIQIWEYENQNGQRKKQRCWLFGAWLKASHLYGPHFLQEREQQRCHFTKLLCFANDLEKSTAPLERLQGWTLGYLICSHLFSILRRWLTFNLYQAFLTCVQTSHLWGLE